MLHVLFAVAPFAFPSRFGPTQLEACATQSCSGVTAHGSAPQTGTALTATGKADGGTYTPCETINLEMAGGTDNTEYVLYASSAGVEIEKKNNGATAVRAPLSGTLALLGVRADNQVTVTYETITLTSDGTTPEGGVCPEPPPPPPWGPPPPPYVVAPSPVGYDFPPPPPMPISEDANQQRYPGGESMLSWVLRQLMTAVVVVAFVALILCIFKKKVMEVGYKKAPKLMEKLGAKAPTTMSYMRGSINATDVGMKVAPSTMAKLNDKAPKLAAKMPAAKKPDLEKGEPEQVRDSAVAVSAPPPAAKPKPPKPEAKPAAELLPEGWEEHLDDATGKPFYSNEETGEVVWVRPKK